MEGYTSQLSNNKNFDNLVILYFAKKNESVKKEFINNY